MGLTSHVRKVFEPEALATARAAAVAEAVAAKLSHLTEIADTAWAARRVVDERLRDARSERRDCEAALSQARADAARHPAPFMRSETADRLLSAPPNSGELPFESWLPGDRSSVLRPSLLRRSRELIHFRSPKVSHLLNTLARANFARLSPKSEHYGACRHSCPGRSAQAASSARNSAGKLHCDRGALDAAEHCDTNHQGGVREHADVKIDGSLLASKSGAILASVEGEIPALEQRLAVALREIERLAPRAAALAERTNALGRLADRGIEWLRGRDPAAVAHAVTAVANEVATITLPRDPSRFPAELTRVRAELQALADERATIEGAAVPLPWRTRGRWPLSMRRSPAGDSTSRVSSIPTTRRSATSDTGSCRPSRTRPASAGSWRTC